MPGPTVAAVIPTKNSAKILRGALDSLWFCDEIIVVDMHSTDETQAICAEYETIRFFQREGYIYGNFNFGIDQAQTEWIIRLDSDERLSPELQDEIRELLASSPKDDIYTAPFVSYVLGHPIHHGSAAEQGNRTTLFRKGSLRYKVSSEHEDLSVCDGFSPTYGELKSLYVHFAVPSVSKYLKKIDYYSERDIERLRGTVQSHPPWRISISALRHFVRYFLLKQGYKDGAHGFTLCSLDALYMFVHSIKIWEFNQNLKNLHDQTRDEYDAKLRRLARGRMSQNYRRR
jgi:glycosyltransferase involved in cell wall biosynthesis